MDSPKLKAKNSFIHTIIKNLFFNSVSGALSRIGSLFFTVIIARILLPDLFGIYSLALTIIITLVAISDFGIGGSITFYIAESIKRNNKTQARSRFIFLLRLKLIAAVILASLLFINAGAISSFFNKPELMLPLKVGAFYLFLYTFYGLITPIFLAFYKLEYNAISESLFQILRLVLIFFFIYRTGYTGNVSFIFILMSLSLLMAIATALVILFKKYSFLIKGPLISVERKRILKFTGSLALSSLGVLIFANIDKLVLGFFLDSKFIGFYAAIFTVISGLIGLFSMGTVFFPVFIKFEGKLLTKYFKQAFRYVSLAVIPASFGLAFIMIPLLGVLYGAEYVPIEYRFSLYLTSIFLSLLIIETIFSGFYKVLLDAKEKPMIPAATVFYSSVANIVLNIFLIMFLIKINPSYGLIGVSLATLISRSSGLIFLVIHTKRKMKIVPDKEPILKSLFASTLMLIYLFIFTKLIQLDIFTGILMIISAATLYVVIILLVKGFSLDELKILNFKYQK